MMKNNTNIHLVSQHLRAGGVAHVRVKGMRGAGGVALGLFRRMQNATHGLPWLSLLLLLASCNASQTPEATDGNAEIRFSPGLWQPATRGTLISDLEALKGSKAAVSAVFSGTPDAGSDAPDAAGKPYFTRLELTCDGGTWNTGGQHYYWPPTQALDFYGRHPYTDGNVDDKTAGRDDHGFRYTTPRDNAGQCDLMYAVTRGRSKSDDPVPLVFRHALAAVVFSAEKESSAMTVSVSGIELCNVSTAADFTYPAVTAGADYSGDDACWTGYDGQTGTLEAGIASGGVNVGTGATLLTTAASGVMTVLPQTLAGWDPKSGTDSPVPAAGQTGCYLRIKCSIQSNGTEFADDGYVYVPFQQELHAGCIYSVALRFGLGYDAGGHTNRVTVTLSAAIQPWTTETDNNDNKPIYPKIKV